MDETYERPIRDASALQSEITRSVAARLRTQLSPNEVGLGRLRDQRPTTLSARPRRTGDLRDEAAMCRDSRDRLSIKLRRDPKFLPAYCELAKAHGRFFTSQIGAKSRRVVSRSSQSAEIALQNAPSSIPTQGNCISCKLIIFFVLPKTSSKRGWKRTLHGGRFQTTLSWSSSPHA
jgi:hypothetical protein